MEELGYQFNAAIIGYDEGLNGNDQALAGAIWRTILEMKCDDPEVVEKMIIYIRKNVFIYFNNYFNIKFVNMMININNILFSFY